MLAWDIVDINLLIDNKESANNIFMGPLARMSWIFNWRRNKGTCGGRNFPSMDGWEESTTLALVVSTLSVEMTTYKTDFFQTWHWNFWREQKIDEKLPIIILKQFCWPAHPFNCLQQICMTVLMYIPYQHCKRKCIIRGLSTRHLNSTIPCHLLYVTQYYQTQSIFCAKCSYNKIIGCAVVLYSLFYRSTKSSLENLWSVQFYFAPASNFNVRFGKISLIYCFKSFWSRLERHTT